MLGGKEYFTRYPYLAPAAVVALAETGVRLVGLDGPSVDYDPGETHIALFGRGTTIVENLINLERLPDTFRLAALPLPIEGGDGRPARVIAVVEQPTL